MCGRSLGQGGTIRSALANYNVICGHLLPVEDMFCESCKAFRCPVRKQHPLFSEKQPEAAYKHAGSRRAAARISPRGWL